MLPMAVVGPGNGGGRGMVRGLASPPQVELRCRCGLSPDVLGAASRGIVYPFRFFPSKDLSGMNDRGMVPGTGPEPADRLARCRSARSFHDEEDCAEPGCRRGKLPGWEHDAGEAPAPPLCPARTAPRQPHVVEAIEERCA